MLKLCARAHTHARTHTHKHTRTRAHTHTHKQTHTHPNMYKYRHALASILLVVSFPGSAAAALYHVEATHDCSGCSVAVLMMSMPTFDLAAVAIRACLQGTCELCPRISTVHCLHSYVSRSEKPLLPVNRVCLSTVCLSSMYLLRACLPRVCLSGVCLSRVCLSRVCLSGGCLSRVYVCDHTEFRGKLKSLSICVHAAHAPAPLHTVDLVCAASVCGPPLHRVVAAMGSNTLYA